MKKNTKRVAVAFFCVVLLIVAAVLLKRPPQLTIPEEDADYLHEVYGASVTTGEATEGGLSTLLSGALENVPSVSSSLKSDSGTNMPPLSFGMSSSAPAPAYASEAPAFSASAEAPAFAPAFSTTAINDTEAPAFGIEAPVFTPSTPNTPNIPTEETEAPAFDTEAPLFPPDDTDSEPQLPIVDLEASRVSFTFPQYIKGNVQNAIPDEIKETWESVPISDIFATLEQAADAPPSPAVPPDDGTDLTLTAATTPSSIQIEPRGASSFNLESEAGLERGCPTCPLVANQAEGNNLAQEKNFSTTEASSLDEVLAFANLEKVLHIVPTKPAHVDDASEWGGLASTSSFAPVRLDFRRLPDLPQNVPAPVQDLALKLLQEPAQDVARNLVHDTAQEVVQKYVPAPVQDLTQKYVPAPVQDLTLKLLQEPAKDVARNLVHDTAQEVVQKYVPAPVQDLTQKYVPAPVQDLTLKLLQEPAQDVARNLVHDTAQEVVQKYVPAPVQDLTQKYVPAPVQDLTQKLLQEPARDVARNLVQETAQKLAQKYVPAPVQNLIEQPIQESYPLQEIVAAASEPSSVVPEDYHRTSIRHSPQADPSAMVPPDGTLPEERKKKATMVLTPLRKAATPSISFSPPATNLAVSPRQAADHALHESKEIALENTVVPSEKQIVLDSSIPVAPFVVANQNPPTTVSIRPEARDNVRNFILAQRNLAATGDPNKMRKAFIGLTRLYDHRELNEAERALLVPTLDRLALDVVFSCNNHVLEQPYIVQAGDTIDSIAKKYNLSAALLMKINGLTGARPLKTGTELKVVMGHFDARVSEKKGELTLVLGGLYAGRFPVQVGREIADLRGEFVVSTKSDSFKGKSLTLDNGVKLCGMDSPLIDKATGLASGDLAASLGLSNRDANELFDILTERSVIVFED